MRYTLGVASNTRISTSPSVSLANYSIDWSFLPKNKIYQLTFSFISDKVNLNQYNDICALTISLGQINSYRTDFGTNGTPTQFLGGLIPHLTGGTGASSFLYADIKTNAGICVMGRPVTNEFTVGLYSLNTGQLWTDFNNNPVTTYGLSLNFDEVGDIGGKLYSY
jgi:hypothetical protein